MGRPTASRLYVFPHFAAILTHYTYMTRWDRTARARRRDLQCAPVSAHCRLSTPSRHGGGRGERPLTFFTLEFRGENFAFINYSAQ
jgi:hypothetical protein